MSYERYATTHLGDAATAAGDYLNFVGDQTFVVDPRAQGFGLREYESLDPHANKFFVLTGKESLFISPAEVSPELLAYYAQIDVEVAKPENILNVGGGSAESSVIERIEDNGKANTALGGRRGGLIVPYMTTPEVVAFAERYGMHTPASAQAVDDMADKAKFQQKLAEISQYIAQVSGYDVAIPTAPLFKAGDRQVAKAMYAELSRGEKRDVMAVKPKSASALGIFVLRSAQGVVGMEDVLDTHFAEDEDVLLEEYIPHNHSPSMQGSYIGGQSAYRHLYFGAQFIAQQGARIEYEGNEIPFGGTGPHVDRNDLGRVQEAHKALGEAVVKAEGIMGVAGFDAVMNISSRGKIENLKLTELNLHLPGSLAVCAAMSKVFPEGFNGIARNWKEPLRSGETPASFMQRIGQFLVREKQTHGLFPINMSYPDKVDVVAFAKDGNQLEQLLAEVRK